VQALLTNDPNNNKLAAPPAPDQLNNIPCNIPCQWEKSATAGDDLHLLTIYGTNWQILQTMENPLFKEYARIERIAYREDVYYSTTSLRSSVPLSYYNFTLHIIRKSTFYFLVVGQ
jgi:hypothetical protein